ncbi:MAG: NTP transferase domain-containing protein [Lachnospiraceae bacterium]|nr:NTP transferase domain-containing protein [Lachnospiraceae bacterium]
MKTGAVILAAGHNVSDEAFQPLMTIGGTTIIRRIIILLKQADVDPIVVITGRNSDQIEKHISKMRTICLRNTDYETTQMFDSIRMGLNYIEDLCDQVLILPVKYPMFLGDTIEKLLKTDSPAACPIYAGRRGHPVLISKELIPKLLHYDGARGLGGALRQESVNPLVKEIPVEDQGITLSIETDDDCEKNYNHSRRIPVHSVIHLYLEGDEIFFGPGIAQFLSLIDHTGSMQTACRQMHMSYSKGWKIIKDAEKQMGFPLLLTKSGGSDGGFSQLTPKSKDYLTRYLAMEKELDAEAKRLFQKYFGEDNRSNEGIERN